MSGLPKSKVFIESGPTMAPVRRRPRRVQTKIDKRRGMLRHGQRHTLWSGIKYMNRGLTSAFSVLRTAAEHAGKAAEAFSQAVSP